MFSTLTTLSTLLPYQTQTVIRTQNDLGEFLFGAPTYSFHVDPTIDNKELQLNIDLTVAMPCHCKLCLHIPLLQSDISHADELLSGVVCRI